MTYTPISARNAASARGDLTVTAGSGVLDPNTITGLVAWYDASNAGSITASGSPSKVSQWNNLKTGAGSGTHQVQATGSYQFTSGTRTQNSLNTLDAIPANGMTATIASPSQPYTIMCVLVPDAVGGSTIAHSGSCSAVILSNQMFMYAGASTYGPTLTAATPYVLGFEYNGASSNFYRNGDAAVSGNAGGSAWGTTIYMGMDSGGVTNFDGLFCEWLMYTSLSSGNRVTVRDYLKTKWNVY